MKLTGLSRALASIALVAVAASCSSGNVAPSGLEAYSLTRADAGAGATPDVHLSGTIDLPRLRTLLPVDQNVTLSMKNAGFQTGRAEAFDVVPRPLPCTTNRRCFGVTTLYQSIALSFHSADGAAASLRALDAALQTYGATSMISPVVGEETASFSGGPRGVTPQAWLLWRRRNVVVILRVSPAAETPVMFRLARAIDARAPKS